MNDGLFIAIYLDEDIHILVGDLLTRRGFRAVTARDADQLGKSDSEQLASAASRPLKNGVCIRYSFFLLPGTSKESEEGQEEFFRSLLMVTVSWVGTGDISWEW